MGAAVVTALLEFGPRQTFALISAELPIAEGLQFIEHSAVAAWPVLSGRFDDVVAIKMVCEFAR